MSNMDFSGHFKNIENLSKQLDNLVKLQNDAYAKLDQETYEKVKQYQIDTNQMLREFKKGNFHVIDEMLKKYSTQDARNNRK